MNSVQEIRETVAESYTRAVTSGGGCCSAGEAKGVAAKVAGYGAGELAGLPEDAVTNSFGCGNPVAFLGVREGEVVLDLGSGAGIDLLLAAKRVGPSGRVIGVDMTDAMIERARANVVAAGVNNVEVRKGLIEALPVESGTVDWVISNCVINLSPEKEQVFAEISRVLKPGGRMVVSDIVVEEVSQALQQSAAAYCACIGGAISETDYVAGLERAGLTAVRVEERLVYDQEQLVALVESEVAPEAAACCGVSVSDLSRDLAPGYAGKVWSARIVAEKPAGTSPAATSRHSL